MYVTGKEQKVLCIPKGIQRTRLMIPWYHLNSPSSRNDGLFRYTKYLSSVTGTPVASYYGTIRFSALLTE